MTCAGENTLLLFLRSFCMCQALHHSCQGELFRTPAPPPLQGKIQTNPGSKVRVSLQVSTRLRWPLTHRSEQERTQQSWLRERALAHPLLHRLCSPSLFTDTSGKETNNSPNPSKWAWWMEQNLGIRSAFKPQLGHFLVP